LPSTDESLSAKRLPPTGDYDRIDELSGYILRHYPYLLTSVEHWALDKLRADMHARAFGFETYELQQLYQRDVTIEGFSDEILNRLYRHRDPRVAKLLFKGTAPFFRRARERVLREHADEIVLNHCPDCDALAVSPASRCCQHCGCRW